VGLRADHAEWAKASPRTLVGIDLTSRGIECTRIRFDLFNLRSKLLVADAETLPFASESLDIVYSWGVLHHTPRTEDAVREVARVLRPGGMARIMIYHRYSLVGAML
jgi:ubiquinone/menaquinone biosynthesis C-methylase UbiE